MNMIQINSTPRMHHVFKYLSEERGHPNLETFKRGSDIICVIQELHKMFIFPESILEWDCWDEQEAAIIDSFNYYNKHRESCPILLKKRQDIEKITDLRVYELFNVIIKGISGYQIFTWESKEKR